MPNPVLVTEPAAAKIAPTAELPGLPAPPGGKQFGWLYLTLSVTFGLVLMFLTPIFQVADEGAQFLRAYELSMGRLTGAVVNGVSGDWLPETVAVSPGRMQGRLLLEPGRKLLPADVADDGQMLIHKSRCTFVDFHLYAVYSPVGYLPQICGIKVAEFFTHRLVAVIYAARLCNLLAGIGLAFLALRVAPCAHASICVLALSPMAFFQSCSAGADVLTNACAVLFFALVWRAAVRGGALRWRDYTGLLLTLFVVTQMKFPYIGLTLLMLLIPASAFGSRLRRYLAVAAIGGLCTVAYLGWFAAVHRLSTPGRVVAGLDLVGQAGFILHHPFTYAGTVIATHRVQGYAHLQEFLGVLGWLDTPIPAGFRFGYGLFILATFALENLPTALRGLARRWWAVAAMGSSWLLVLTFIYMYWNPVGAPLIEGIQGRYFIPLALGLVVAGNLRETTVNRDAWHRFYFTGIVTAVSLMVTCITVKERYYPL